MTRYSTWLAVLLLANLTQLFAEAQETDPQAHLQALHQAVFQQKLTAADGAEDDHFGVAVGLWGEVAMIGAQYQDEAAADAGAVYVYTHDGLNWNFQQKLLASDAAAGDRFGATISLRGDRVVIGAPLDNGEAGDSGSAYVFGFNGSSWVEEQKLTASDPGSADFFGRHIDLDGDRVIISADGDDELDTNAGAAYVFDFDGVNWQETIKLMASDGLAHDGFASSVTLDGDRAVIGAMLNDESGTSSGKAYVFEFNGTVWSEVQKLSASDAAAQALFGVSADLLDNRLVIGASRANGNTTASGSVYVFEHNGSAWSESQKLTASGIPTSGQFGISLGLQGNRLLVGANRDDEAFISSGSVYVFDHDGTAWQPSDVLLANDAAFSDQFGYAISHSAGRVLVGAFQDDDLATDSGSAYVFNSSFTVSVQVNGLENGQSLHLLNNGTDSLEVTANGRSSFSEALFSGEAYQVTVAAQPVSPNKTCTVVAGSGTVDNDLVVLTVNCVTNQYPVQVITSGLATGNSLVLSQGQTQYPVLANGSTTLTALDDGSAYAFSISQQPTTPNQTCTFTTTAAGTVSGAAVQLGVDCVINQYFIGGGLTGLAGGNQVTLQNNATNDTLLTSNGAFSFSQPLADGSDYAVTVLDQPTSPNQSCVVNHGTGQIAGDDVIDVQVQCTTLQYSVAGEVFGLLPGNWLVLQNNGADDLLIMDDGDFAFPLPVEDGQNYQVTLLLGAENPIQPCELQNAQGQIQGADVHDVTVICALGDDLIYRHGFDSDQAIGGLTDDWLE
jgi:hypothetical protein